VVVAVQWAPGQTLRERIAAKVLSPDEARPLVAQLAAGLTHAHQHGVVLGDVHAATVVLLGQTLKIANVGIGPALPRKRFLEAARGSDRMENASGPIPKVDDVRPPSSETTRAMDADELALLKGDQITRQVPVDEIFPLRVASSETQQFELEEMIVDESEGAGGSTSDELTLEKPPMAARDEDSRTDQVVLLEPDAARTTEHPRLPPPV